MEGLDQELGSLTLRRTSSVDTEVELDSLCVLCFMLFQDKLCMGAERECFERHGQYHYHITKLRQSAAEGCHLCDMILYQIDTGADYNFPEDFPVNDFTPWIMMWTNENVVHSDFDADSEVRWTTSHYFLVHRERPREQIGSIGEINIRCRVGGVRPSDEAVSDELEHPGFLDDRLTTTSSSSNKSMQKIEAWLKECFDSHEKCKQVARKRRIGINGSILPTRLVDLTTLDTKGVVRIIETKYLPPDTAYMTLSHCWGSKKTLMLTKENANDLVEGVEASKLPATYRDAANVARRLQGTYLWIDSLCIIQDSREDWLNESATMAAVYANAMLNIAASSASDATQGLFRNRDPLPLTECYVEASCDCTESQWLELSGAALRSQEPLLDRAWVVQELALAQRVVKFGHEMVSWECHSESAIESGSFYSREDPMRGWLSGLQDVVSADDKALDDSDLVSWRVRGEHRGVEPHLGAWLGMISRYSRMGLTFEEDKLVAIAGVARQFHNSVGDCLGQYLAGLWESNLILQLNWRSDRWDGLRGRPKEWRAPTWSWASVNGSIRSGGPTHINWRYDCLITEVMTTPLSDKFGAVKNGSLWMLGHLCQITMRPKIEVRFHPDTESNREVDLCVDIDTETIDVNLWDLSMDDSNIEFDLRTQSKQFFVMPLFEEKHAHQDWGFQALLLQHTGQKGQFYRVGLISPDWHTAEPYRKAFAEQMISSDFHRGQDISGRYHVELI